MKLFPNKNITCVSHEGDKRDALIPDDLDIERVPQEDLHQDEVGGGVAPGHPLHCRAQFLDSQSSTLRYKKN